MVNESLFIKKPQSKRAASNDKRYEHEYSVKLHISIIDLVGFQVAQLAVLEFRPVAESRGFAH